MTDMMMDGIEVLSTTEITKNIIEPYIGLAIVFGCIFLLIEAACDDRGIGMMLSLFGLLAGFVILIISVGITVHTGTYEYKITISDNVSYHDFVDKYDVVETDGSILTVRRKEP